ncbi:RluA family pseudouridine synthase [Portibacter marinus]|uniref:RluA family pseudouridine synthase n=1 Tax=Portibacter marinus TaxID=2898660 RepID=UPI001F208225|nr:RluA family pseudouridine synthase [Portibacter marinus]
MKPLAEILFEDEFLIVVNKPSGIPVIPTRTAEMDKSLKYYYKKKLGEIFIVHRIDMETSGIVILAKDAETHRLLSLMFQNRQIRKFYVLLTRGLPRPDEGQIDLPLKKLNNQNKSVVAKDGKSASTVYKVVETFGNFALLEAEILTGRHHQIRVHFQNIITPLLVDPIYGDNAFFLSEIKGKKYRKAKHEEEKPLLSRVSLHAHKLEFKHPMTNNSLELAAELPKDLRAVINQLRKSV